MAVSVTVSVSVAVAEADGRLCSCGRSSHCVRLDPDPDSMIVEQASSLLIEGAEVRSAMGCVGLEPAS